MATAVQKLVQVLASSRFYPSAMVLRWANRAERDIAQKTGCLKSVDNVTAAASSRRNTFSGHRVTSIEYVPSSGSRRTLMRMSPGQIGKTRTEGTEPKFYFQWGTQVHVEPSQPASPAGSLNLYIDDYPEYEMTQATDATLIPADFSDAIVLYGQMMAALKDRKWGRAITLYHHYRAALSTKAVGDLNTPDSRYKADFHEKREAGRYK